MFLDDRVGERQAEPGALADFLGGEEGVEDARLVLRRHPRSVVGDLEDDQIALRVVPGPDDQRAAAVRRLHGLLGVGNQVQQHLLHLVLVDEDLGQPAGQGRERRDVVDALIVGAQGQRVAHHLVEIDHRPGGRALADERQQVPDDSRRAFGLGEDHVHAALADVVERQFRQPFRPAENRRQRVVQLVRHARHQLADRRQLLVLQQLLVQLPRAIVEPLALGGVAQERVDQDAAALGGTHVRRHVHLQQRLVGLAHPQQVVRDAAFAGEPVEEAGSRGHVGEPRRRKRIDRRSRNIERQAEQPFERRVGDDCSAGFGGAGIQHPDEDALLQGIEEPGEGVRAFLIGRRQLDARHQGLTSCAAGKAAPVLAWPRGSAAGTSCRSRREWRSPKRPS